jgi:hypothetical protein
LLKAVCCVVCSSLWLVPLLRGANHPCAADLAATLREISLNPEETYRVRELQLTRGDVKIYLTEGVLSFFTPVAGHYLAATFTTSDAEAGDAEVLVLPPRPSERASLASYINSPNLDEHFTSALFLFTDRTAEDLMEQIQQRPVRRAPEVGSELEPLLNPVVRTIAAQIDVRLVQALLDHHSPENGFFYSLVIGRELGNFDVLYAPADFEPVSVGRVASSGNGQQTFQLWTSFRPRRAPPFVQPAIRLSDYRIDATIHPDLSMSDTAKFAVEAAEQDGRVLAFGLSGHLHVVSASIDGKPSEIFQRDSARLEQLKSAGSFLVVSDLPLTPGSRHTVEVRYEGSTISERRGAYFVDERSVWYPFDGSMQTNFDLTFRCPERLRLVSTGELIGEEVDNGIRVVHRKTPVAEHLAGFNLGEYNVTGEEHNAYEIDCYANKASAFDVNLRSATADILDEYTRRWGRLPIHTIAISPVPAYFGQGFPGLIYLSSLSYMHQEDRPVQLRNQETDIFFSDLLLPHEVAHQWWGNLVTPADYRTNWLMEAMASDSALQILQRRKGAAAVAAVLNGYRGDLMKEKDGKPVRSLGPVDFGDRLIATGGFAAWHTIVYERGTWILRILRQRLGDDGFEKLQLRMIQQFTAKPISNEDFRSLASDLLPVGQPDKGLNLFFDTWVYGTGIPRMRLHRSGRNLDLQVSDVDQDFVADVPLRCSSGAGPKRTRWVRANAGSNLLDAAQGTGTCELPSPTDYLYLP